MDKLHKPTSLPPGCRFSRTESPAQPHHTRFGLDQSLPSERLIDILAMTASACSYGVLILAGFPTALLCYRPAKWVSIVLLPALKEELLSDKHYQIPRMHAEWIHPLHSSETLQIVTMYVRRNGCDAGICKKLSIGVDLLVVRSISDVCTQPRSDTHSDLMLLPSSDVPRRPERIVRGICAFGMEVRSCSMRYSDPLYRLQADQGCHVCCRKPSYLILLYLQVLIGLNETYDLLPQIFDSGYFDGVI